MTATPAATPQSKALGILINAIDKSDYTKCNDLQAGDFQANDLKDAFEHAAKKAAHCRWWRIWLHRASHIQPN